MKGTVKSKRDIERLFQTGRRSSSYLMTVLAAPTPAACGEPGRCAFIAGKKLGSAPVRNRCKRVLRACVAEIGGPWQGFDVAFIAKHKVAHTSHERVVRELKRQVAELGVI